MSSYRVPGAKRWGGVSSVSDTLPHISTFASPAPAVVIDTASGILVCGTASALCRELRGLLDDGLASSVTLVVHRSLAGQSTLATLRSVCSAYLELKVVASSGTPRVCSRLEIVKASGKVVAEVCELAVADYAVSVIRSGTSLEGADGSDDGSGSGHAHGPVSSSDKSGGAEATASLPYTLTEEQKQGILSGSGQGRIYYQPDDGDDFDEEDPDDDLDI
eukprot:m.15900 g.15900  ORF g.15900 m.15900 type:complete len:219 (-) comp4980_c0_seq2:300-956(-)